MSVQAGQLALLDGGKMIKRFLLISILSLCLVGSAQARIRIGTTPLIVQEEDGDPKATRVRKILVTDGSLTKTSNSEVIISTGGAAVEGTAVLSTGEGGGTKYLREDGDGTCSWQTPAGAGDLLADGTVPMTANWEFGNFDLTLKSIIGDGSMTMPTLIINLIDTTGAADIDYGSVDVTDHTFITDGTGTAEMVFPAGSIDGTEILDDTVDSPDYAANSIDEEHLSTGFLVLPVQSAKITGGCVTNGDASQGAQIEGGEDSWALLFDDTTDEGACWDFIMPETYNTTTMTIELVYSMASAVADEVEWEGYWCIHSEGEDLDTLGCDTIKSFGGDTVENNAGEVSMVSQTFTSAEADDVVKGDICQFGISTDSDDAVNDDATGNRELRGVILRW